jgi:multiple RNA-binding domain-containing protein 1
MGIRKSDILNPDSVASDDVDGRFSTVGSAVKLALAEANVIAETKKYFETHGVNLTAFDEVKDVAGRVVRTARSKTGLLVKNIPYGTSEEVLRALFEPHGTIRTLLLPPAGTLAIIDFEEEGDAASAFKSVSYRRLGNAVVYLEKAPDGLFDGTISAEEETKKISPADQLAEEAKKRVEGAPEGEDEVEAGSTLFLKNLSFATTSERLHAVFSSLPSFAFARVSTKPDPKNATGPRLSMGFGFIGFKTREAAKKAMSGLKGFKLDGHELEVKFAQREADVDGGKAKGGASDAKKKKTTKMIVKNVPFEASKKDIKDLFR